MLGAQVLGFWFTGSGFEVRWWFGGSGSGFSRVAEIPEQRCRRGRRTAGESFEGGNLLGRKIAAIDAIAQVVRRLL